jgi:hypothetical protein
MRPMQTAFMSNSRDCHRPRGIVIALGQAGTADLLTAKNGSDFPTGRPILLRRLDRARHSGQVAQRSATGLPLLPRMPARFDGPLPILIAVRDADRPTVGTGRSCAGYSGRETEVRSRAIEIAPGDTRHGRLSCRA